MPEFSSSKTLDTVLLLIRQLATAGDLPSVLANAPLSSETRLEQMGLDSVGKVTLLLAIDEQLNIYVPEDFLSPQMTLDELALKVAANGRKV